MIAVPGFKAGEEYFLTFAWNEDGRSHLVCVQRCLCRALAEFVEQAEVNDSARRVVLFRDNKHRHKPKVMIWLAVHVFQNSHFYSVI